MSLDIEKKKENTKMPKLQHTTYRKYSQADAKSSRKGQLLRLCTPNTKAKKKIVTTLSIIIKVITKDIIIHNSKKMKKRNRTPRSQTL